MSDISLREIAEQVSCNNMRALAKRQADHNNELMMQQFRCKQQPTSYFENDSIQHVGHIPSQVVTYKDCVEKRDNDMEWWDQQFYRHVQPSMNVPTRMKISTKK